MAWGRAMARTAALADFGTTVFTTGRCFAPRGSDWDLTLPREPRAAAALTFGVGGFLALAVPARDRSLVAVLRLALPFALAPTLRLPFEVANAFDFFGLADLFLDLRAEGFPAMGEPPEPGVAA
jgi:hypothetical protein